MSKINAELWKEIQNNIYPDPHKTHEAIYAIIQSQITLAQQRTEKKWRDEGFRKGLREAQLQLAGTILAQKMEVNLIYGDGTGNVELSEGDYRKIIEAYKKKLSDLLK